MSERDKIELVKRCYSDFLDGHTQQALDLFADDLDFQHPMPQSIWPWAGKRSGRRGLAEFFTGIGETLEYERLEPYQFIAQNDWVAVLLFERARVKATGVVYEISEVHVHKLKNGKVVQSTVFRGHRPNHRRAARLPKNNSLQGSGLNTSRGNG